MNLEITHSSTQVKANRRFPGDITVGKLKEKLYIIVGTAPEYQELKLKDQNGKIVKTLQPDDATLEMLGVVDNSNIYVVDNDPMNTAASYQDVSKVEKFRLTDEEYNKRDNTFRKFKNNFLKDKVEEEKKRAQEKAEQLLKELEIVDKIKVGNRCEVYSGTEKAKRGEVKFVGDVEWNDGPFVGIQLDEPIGKNDGKTRGRRYFTCPPKYGIFVRPSKVSVGDYPEIDPFDEDSDEDLMAEL